MIDKLIEAAKLADRHSADLPCALRVIVTSVGIKIELEYVSHSLFSCHTNSRYIHGALTPRLRTIFQVPQRRQNAFQPRQAVY